MCILGPQELLLASLSATYMIWYSLIDLLLDSWECRLHVTILPLLLLSPPFLIKPQQILMISISHLSPLLQVCNTSFKICSPSVCLPHMSPSVRVNSSEVTFLLRFSQFFITHILDVMSRCYYCRSLRRYIKSYFFRYCPFWSKLNKKETECEWGKKYNPLHIVTSLEG